MTAARPGAYPGTWIVEEPPMVAMTVAEFVDQDTPSRFARGGDTVTIQIECSHDPGDRTRYRRAGGHPIPYGGQIVCPGGCDGDGTIPHTFTLAEDPMPLPWGNVPLETPLPNDGGTDWMLKEADDE